MCRDVREGRIQRALLPTRSGIDHRPMCPLTMPGGRRTYPFVAVQNLRATYTQRDATRAPYDLKPVGRPPECVPIRFGGLRIPARRRARATSWFSSGACSSHPRRGIIRASKCANTTRPETALRVRPSYLSSPLPPAWQWIWEQREKVSVPVPRRAGSASESFWDSRYVAGAQDAADRAAAGPVGHCSTDDVPRI